MSFQRSKEDHIGLISKSIFVTNFPDDVGSSDLWKVCEGYGKVVDVFIPNRRSKAGKRFAFVRFIRVDNIDRLVRNLCTIWIGRFHLHANVVRFERASKHVTLANNTQSKVHGNVGSYATAVRGKTPVSSTLALILDEACAITRDLSRHVMGKVKDINSISNLRTLLAKEGFPKAKLTFLGGLWVMIELDSEATKCSLLDHVDLEGVPLNLWSRETFLKIGNKWGEALDIEDNSGSSFARKRLCVLTKQPDSILEKFKVIYKGRVFLVRAKELFTWTPIFLEPQEMGYTSDGESVHGENKQPGGLQLSDEESDGDSDVDGVPDTVFGDNSFSHHAPRGDSDNQQSDDPFGFYDLLKKQNVHKDDDLANETTVNGVDNENTSVVNAQVMNNSQEVPDSAKVDSTSLNSGPIHNGGSILDVLEDMIKVGQSMGYNLEGCMKDIERIIRSQGVDDETKLERVTHMDVKLLWGNSNYQFIASNSVGVSGEYSLSGLLSCQPIAFTSSLFPSITALCLDRHLSDHRPILLHEVHTDFGPIPFRFYQSVQIWIAYEDKDLKIIIRRWVKDRKSQQFGVKNSLISELGDIDKALDHGNVSDTVLLKRMELMHQLQDINMLEARESYRKSKIKWADKCDEKLKNSFMEKETFRNPFSSSFKQPSLGRFKLNSVFTNRLSLDQVVDLDSNVSRDEIRKAVWDYGENKSPGPDGYTPISLIGCVYKVVTKILANRLAMVISDLISDTQSAFVAKRQILDGPFILNELLSWCKKTKKQAMFFKVDFAKAYDSVRWDYLLDVLQAFGFGPNWCRWIREDLLFAMGFPPIPLGVNGRPTRSITFFRGLKQGDPLSPYLFILIMESLHISFSRAIADGEMVRIKSEKNSYHPNCFFLASGLKINIQKSQLLGVGVPRSSVAQAAAKIGCAVLHHQFRYLGVMVGECMSRRSAWDGLVHKLRSRAHQVEDKTLSIEIPKGVLKDMEAIRSKFFNGADSSERKITWIAWEKVLGVLKKWMIKVYPRRLYVIDFVSQPSFNQASIGASILTVRINLLKAKVFDFYFTLQEAVGDVLSTQHGQRGFGAAKLGLCRLMFLQNGRRDGCPNGEFRVKEVRNFLDELYLPSHSEATRWVKVEKDVVMEKKPREVCLELIEAYKNRRKEICELEKRMGDPFVEGAVRMLKKVQDRD
ncbi:RNA-directed DNA polymerase, eukaryota [Tanacetum coccineum]|uniref:RNA-directed DNA polymerase, eukaryota n=1 Tax=Tanacetum coccineum TaxID=301880 RepID=A0ABQ5IZV9_9ASTR